jgi:hypothetical protein
MPQSPVRHQPAARAVALPPASRGAAYTVWSVILLLVAACLHVGMITGGR